MRAQLLISVCVLGISDLTLVVSADDTSKDQYDSFQVTVRANLIEVGNILRADLDAGPLPAGQRGTILLEIANNTSFDLPVASLKASCSCERAVLRGNELPAGQSSIVEVKVETPVKRASPDFASSIRLAIPKSAPGPTDQVVLNLHFQLTGMLCFGQQLIPLEVAGKDEMEFDIPYVSTLDAATEKLQLELVPHVVGVDAKLAVVSGKKVLRFMVLPSVISAEGAHFQAKLSDAVTGLSDEATIVIKHAREVVVTPRTLRFRVDDGDCTATALIRIAKHRSAKNAQREVIEAYVGQSRMRVKTNTLAPGIHRVTITADKDALESQARSGSDEIAFSIMTSSEKLNYKSRFVLTDN